MYINTVWFNHTFSTEYHVIKALREGAAQHGGEVLNIIGSNKDANCIYKTVCDVFFKEPDDLTDEEYVDYALSVCKVYKVDVFFPKRCRNIISKYKDKFTEIGVAVIISADYELLTNLENKKYTNEIVGRYHLCKCIPSFYATNLEEFKQAYTSVKNLGGDFENCRVCMKYTEDEGAVSFRVIVPDEEVDFRRISSPIGAKISYSEVLKILSSEPEFKELMIMPFLNGLDVTIDSFMGDYNFFAVSRYKLGNRRVLVENNEQFYNLSKQFAIMTGLKGLYNIQLKGHNEEWYFLEVNTRMAGGIHKAISCGVNLPYLAYADAIGKDISDKAKELQEHFGDRQHLSQIETPIMLENDGLTARDLTAIDLILRG